jgi:DNA-binding GntR family transcriptional regulator
LTLKASRRLALSDQVYEHVKELLLDGSLRAGSWIPVETLAKDLNASRQPVMDSLKRLALEGFVTIVPQVGSRVRAYEIGEMLEFYALHASGEALIAELAAARAEQTEVLGLRMLSGQIGQLIESGFPQVEMARMYRRLNRRFHADLRAAAKSAPIADIVSLLGDRSDFFVATADRLVFAEGVKLAHGEHEAILEAIERRDPIAARSAMAHHITATGMRLRQAFPAEVPNKDTTAAL